MNGDDWAISLPKELEIEFGNKIKQHEDGKEMRYVTNFERMGIKKGRKEGVQEGIQILLDAKFGELGKQLIPSIERIEGLRTLKRIMKKTAVADSLEEVRASLP